MPLVELVLHLLWFLLLLDLCIVTLEVELSVSAGAEDARASSSEEGAPMSAAGSTGGAKAKRKAALAKANAEGAKGTMLDAFVPPAAVPAAAAAQPQEPPRETSAPAEAQPVRA